MGTTPNGVGGGKPEGEGPPEAAHLSRSGPLGDAVLRGILLDRRRWAGESDRVATHTSFDYTVRYEDPAIPVFTGHQVTSETFTTAFTPKKTIGVYSFHMQDTATADDGTRMTVRETLHYTVQDGQVIIAAVEDFTFTC